MPLIKTALLIMRPGQPDETQHHELEQEPGYGVLKRILTPLLDGANLERVSVLADFAGGTKFKPLDMFVDDEGMLKHLPRNEAATTIYRRANQMGRSAAPKAEHVECLHHICGPAILFDRLVWF